MAEKRKLDPKQPAQIPPEPEKGELDYTELDDINGGENTRLLTTTMSNLANMRHEMLKAVANNLRA